MIKDPFQYRANIKLFTFAQSLAGMIFGINITVFNVFDIKIFNDSANTESYFNAKYFNIFFSLGGLICSLISGLLIQKFGRKYLNLNLIVWNIFFTLMQQFSNKFILYLSRFFVGFIATFYTFLSPIMFKEYLPGNDSGVHGSFFYIGLTFGSCLSVVFFTNLKSLVLARILFIIPAGLEFIRLFIYLKYFNQESPRFGCLQILSLHNEKLSDLINEDSEGGESKSQMDSFSEDLFDLKEDDEENMLEENLIEQSLEMDLTNVSRRINSSVCKYSKAKEELALLAKESKNVKHYFHSFFGEEKYDKLFSIFFDDFMEVFHPKFIAPISKPWNVPSLIFDMNYRLQFFVIFFLNFLSQMTGINCLMFYSNSVFSNFSHLGSPLALSVLISKNNCRLHLICKFSGNSGIDQSTWTACSDLFRA